jgi:hypothetical protein
VGLKLLLQRRDLDCKAKSCASVLIDKSFTFSRR